MIVDSLIVPPIRTALTEPNGANGNTAKEWYYYWQQAGDSIGTLSRALRYGTHADRVKATAEPPGGLWAETDRSGVIYQAQVDANGNRKWMYVAGVMMGTRSPDQRPTDLGLNDAGFQFRATDGTNTGRTFYWSGGSWIETTEVQYGTHAVRPSTTFAPTRSFYVETDRGNVIYQNQAGNWIYVAGTMLGTLAPDQRPTDLGANDTGFRFEAADTVQQFYWSGSTWIQTTAVTYGTHAVRPAASAMRLRTLYIETDRGNAIYQQQNGNWVYVAGTMRGTLSPDQRPAGLTAYDTGFDFLGTDQQREYYWTGSAWLEVASQPGDVQRATASSNYTLTITRTAVPGATLTLNRAGRYLITGNFYFAVADPGVILRGHLTANGVDQAGEAIFSASATTYGGAAQFWIYQATAAAQVVLLTAYKDSGAGGSYVFAPHTSIVAQWISP